MENWRNFFFVMIPKFSGILHTQSVKEEEHGNLYLFRGSFMHKYQSVSKIEIIMVILWNICVGDFFL